jgi:YD repeat-containing protein
VSLIDQYDPLGDLTQITGTGAEAATPAQSFGYDLDGRLTSATAPGGTGNGPGD